MAAPEDARQNSKPPKPRDHRRAVGPPALYDLVSHMQFNLLTLLGLREEHTLLDIGCGSLRGGRLFIVYLRSGHYFGLEPDAQLIQEGIEKELGPGLIELKKPRFSHDSELTCTLFNREFDFLLAQSIFSHAAPAQIRRCLAQARACMRADSLFAATFVEGDENYAGDHWVYPRCVTYRFSWLADTAAEAGLACSRIQWFHPNRQTWVLLTLPENRPGAEGLATLNQMYALREQVRHYQKILPPMRRELRECQGRLARLEQHPYVRLGRALNRTLKKIAGQAL